jgi:hypothetical protein
VINATPLLFTPSKYPHAHRTSGWVAPEPVWTGAEKGKFLALGGVCKVRERLSVSKGTAQKFATERFILEKPTGLQQWRT